MKHLAPFPARRLPSRRAGLLGLLLATGAATLSLAGCADEKVHQAGAQTAESTADAGNTGSDAAPEAPKIAAEDTATRRVGAALSEQPDSARADSIAKADSVKENYAHGEDPEFARQMGWPVKSPKALEGAILPEHRIVAYYGNPRSTRMGVLGEYPKDEMLRKLDQEVAAWNRADPEHPVKPALHLIAVVAQADPGKAGKYRMIMPDTVVKEVYNWAKSKNAILFIDIQTGTSTIQELLPRFDWILKEPDVHVAVDPEFMMVHSGSLPGRKIGTMTVADINYVTNHVKELVQKNDLPPKVVIVHRFTRNMVQGDTKDILLRPEVQLVVNMDGWGAPWLKRDSYRDYIVRHPVEYTGFKIFYHNDQKKEGSRLMTKEEVLRLRPQPLYIQYQ